MCENALDGHQYFNCTTARKTYSSRWVAMVSSHQKRPNWTWDSTLQTELCVVRLPSYESSNCGPMSSVLYSLYNCVTNWRSHKNKRSRQKENPKFIKQLTHTHAVIGRTENILIFRKRLDDWALGMIIIITRSTLYTILFGPRDTNGGRETVCYLFFNFSKIIKADNDSDHLMLYERRRSCECVGWSGI